MKKRDKLRRFVSACSASILVSIMNITCVLAKEERPKLTIDGPSPHGFTHSRLENGTMYVASCKDEAGREYGAILIWQSGKSGELTDLKTVSSLDKILSSQVEALGIKPERKKIMEMIAPAISEYAQLASGGSILYANEFQSFLNQMKARVPVGIYEVLKKRLVYPSGATLDETWTLPMFILKDDGAIELETFSGSFSPFSITKIETEVLLRSGSIPIGLYSPQAVDER